ncbi:Nucleotide-binding, alpha-beta plait [Ophiocordyceps sinensis CO18]|uniref:Nucleotide-binding, alpha-beta plait n=1 Tax=Ophiocordyceps sinensis (strain Co18 / CGMCC 3.14243) TaxID=911162 RepID=T5APJ2_OPHSC|nr:Nucleotide-binding, alpha-beta plait [Ophiocordyceps sinensis CO18]
MTSTKRKSSSKDEIEVDLSAPEPQSKRARRALKKGKALPTKPSSDADKEDSDADKKDKARLLIKDAKSFEGRPKKEKEPATDDAADAGAGKVVNASRKVFVGNMSFKTTEEDLTRNFEKCGEIEWVKVATFEDSGMCKGFGWIRFKEPEAAAWAVKGFVKINEDVEIEADFKSDNDDEGGGDADEKKPQWQSKTRKWWVNRLLGRQLKLELAEDDQTRYKKRFRKDAPKRDGAPKASSSRDGKRPSAGGAGARADGAADKGPAPLKEASDIGVAKLTGALVKHTGTKMTFN